MAAKEPILLYVARYGSVSDALAALDDIEQRKYELAGTYDAAVIDEENGELHIVKRMHRPGLQIIPEALGSGTLPGQELKDTAREPTTHHTRLLIVLSKPIVETGIDKALTDASAVVERAVDSDAIISELREALKD
jgi:hypothetical protein